jgi:hypothetical protein
MGRHLRAVWSPLRGFARTSERYKALLQAGLVDWVHYVLDTCMDQVSFMSARLNVGNMKDGIAAAAALPLCHADGTEPRRIQSHDGHG